METNAASGQLVYEDFVPSYKLVREEGIDTLVVELSEFKKEQVRVQLEKFGILSISGERHLGGDRRSRFRSVFQFPEDCNEMRTKFENGRLYVKVLPKLITETSTEVAIKETRAKNQATQVQKPSVGPNGVPKKRVVEKRGEPTDTRKEAEKEKDQIEEKKDMEKFREPELDLGISKPMQILVNIIVGVVVFVVMVLYVTSKN